MKKLLFFLLFIPSLVDAQVNFVNFGTGAASGSAVVNVPYPATVTANNLFVILLYDKSVAADAVVTTPTGWTAYPTNTPPTTTGKLYILYKIADGTETGSVSVPVTGTLDSRSARMYQFSGNATAGTIIEAGNSLTATNSTILQPTTPIVGANDIAIWAVGMSDDTGPSATEPGVATGGIWSDRFANRFGTTQGSDCQVNMLYSSGSGSTITGGEYYFSGPDEWISYSFVIRSSGAVNPVTPAAPTAGVVDDVNNTFNWTNNPSFTSLSHYEYSIDGGTTVQDVTAKPISVGNVSLAAGQVRVRIKAMNGNPASAWLASTSVFTVTSNPVTPAAPTASVVDDVANTFNWTNNPGFTALTDYEFTTNGGTTVQNVTAKPIPVGDVALAVGQVGVRVKAMNGNPVSAWLFSATAFTASQPGAQVIYQTPNSSRTEFRDDAGLRGDAGAKSGFFETTAPVNYPIGASSWWHLLDIRHSNTGNNYAMQFAGSFFNQELFFRKTADNSSAPWRKIVTGSYGTLGTSVGNTLDLMDLNASTAGSDAYLKVLLRRHTAGTGWEKASTRLQAMTDATYQGYIDFNPNGAPQGISFGVNNNEFMRIMANGNVLIGTEDAKSTNYKLAVNGSAIFTRAVVKLYSAWPDYVFETSYKLPTIREVEQFIKQHKHLPGVPSAKEVEAHGLDVGENQAVLLKKIEELTLYLIQQQKELERSQELLEVQQRRNEGLEARLQRLEALLKQ